MMRSKRSKPSTRPQVGRMRAQPWSSVYRSGQTTGGVRGVGDPVEHDVGEELILGKPTFHVPVAVAPGTELLDDPGGQAGGRVVQAVGQRLRLRPLDTLVPGLLLEKLLRRHQVD